MIKIYGINNTASPEKVGEEVVVEKYPNGETRIELKHIIPNESAKYEVVWKYESDADFLRLLFVSDYIRRHDKRNPSVVLSILYMPYSRMDRSENGSVYTLKSACRLINSIEFDVVNVFEPHSAKTAELLNNSNVVDVSDVLATMAMEDVKNEHPDTPVYLFYPDKGAQARYEMPDVPYLCGKKVRDFDTGRIVSYEVVDGEIFKQMNRLTPFNVVIIDDLSSYGGTFVQASKKLKELGAQHVYLAVAHAEESVYKGKLFDHIDKLYTTNSIINEAQNDKTTMLELF